ncbi:MAG: type IV secretion system protein [Sinobacteraceae bacterium]|nr:type IV secretion system protein [Nevskiaceae bacterium]
MGFFATFWSWLNQQLMTYVGDNTARIAAALEPAIVTLATVYVMIWGYLQLTGRIDEPVTTGLRRIITLAIILAVSLRLWLYNSIIVDTFYSAPAQLAAAVAGASDPVSAVDAIWDRGGAVADYLWNNGGVFNNEMGYYIAGLVVWVLIGLLCVYTMFLVALSHVALAILLALGPLFIALALFDSTRRLFDAWLAQLANYALITILTVMVAGLLLQIVQTYAAQTAARGAAIVTVDALNMVLIAALVFMFMRQIMPIAASLCGGSALSTFGSMSRAVGLAARTGVSSLRWGSSATAALLARPHN